LTYRVHCRVFKLNEDIKESDDILYGVIGDNVVTLKSDKDECLMYYQIKPYLRPMSSMTDEERGEFRKVGGVMSHSPQHDTWAISAFAPEAYDWLNAHHFDYRGLIEKGLALEAPKGMYPEPKWLYRLEYKDNTNGLWYNGNGNWCFEKGIGSIEGCKTKNLPMDYDERYKQDGRDWFSSCSKKEDLLHWYSLEDAKKLLENGFVFTRYLATEYHEYDLETVFIKETSIDREVLDIFDLFKDN
jgi:hypothetical protein